MKKAEKIKPARPVVRELVSADDVSRVSAADEVPSGAVALRREYTPADVSHAWNRAINGLRDVVAFGAILCEVDTCLTRETSKRTDPRGGLDTLKAWLAEHCPEVNYKTAMRFRRLAVIAMAESGAGQIEPGEAIDLLTGSAKPGTSDAGGEDERKLAALEDFLAGKSQRDILQAWTEGGSRPGRVAGSAGAKGESRAAKTPEQVREEKRAEAAQALMTARNCLRALTTDLGLHLNPATARGLLTDIRNDIKVIAANLEG